MKKYKKLEGEYKKGLTALAIAEVQTPKLSIERELKARASPAWPGRVMAH
jgi:hypothetical protein